MKNLPTRNRTDFALTTKAIIAFTAFSLATSLAAGRNRKIAFSRNENIWVANADGSGAKIIRRGSWPNISPDGARVVFNTEESDKKNGPVRRIAVVEIATGKTTVFKNLPSDNCFGPVWSPDGRQIAFHIFTESNWQIGAFDSDGSDFHYIKKSEPNGLSYWSICWAPDGRSIFCQDIQHLFRFSLDGTPIKQWDIAQLTGGNSMNSGSQLDVSPDGRCLIFEVDLAGEPARKDWDDAQPAIYTFDLASEKADRVTGKSDFAWDPCWLTNDDFFCVIQDENESEPSLYRMRIGERRRTLIAKHAGNPSVSAAQP